VFDATQYHLTNCFHTLITLSLNGSDFPNYHRLRFYSLEVTATIAQQRFCTDLISNTHKDSCEPLTRMLPALFPDAMLKRH
jgi:hypothetical protein